MQDEIPIDEPEPATDVQDRYLLTDEQVNELFAHIKKLDGQTRKVVALYTTQIATRAALHAIALKRSRKWRKQAPCSTTVSELTIKGGRKCIYIYISKLIFVAGNQRSRAMLHAVEYQELAQPVSTRRDPTLRAKKLYVHEKDSLALLIGGSDEASKQNPHRTMQRRRSSDSNNGVNTPR